jgi:hypothetical protein
MKVQVEGNIYLESDEHQFIIKEYTGKIDKNGNDLYTTHAYVTSLESAFKFLVKLKVKQSTASNLNELIIDLKRIEQFIRDQLSIDVGNGIKEAV